MIPWERGRQSVAKGVKAAVQRPRQSVIVVVFSEIGIWNYFRRQVAGDKAVPVPDGSQMGSS
jgi:hypothetical protein